MGGVLFAVWLEPGRRLIERLACVYGGAHALVIRRYCLIGAFGGFIVSSALSGRDFFAPFLKHIACDYHDVSSRLYGDWNAIVAPLKARSGVEHVDEPYVLGIARPCVADEEVIGSEIWHIGSFALSAPLLGGDTIYDFGVAVCVGVGVAVGLGVLVGIGVGVIVGAEVGVAVAVGVWVDVGIVVGV